MPLFDLTRPPDDDEFIGSDAATRALSVTAVENDFVAAVYEKLASVYDFTFGPTASPRPRRRHSADENPPRAIACSRSASARASTRACIRSTVRGWHRSVELDAGEGAERVWRKGLRNVRLQEMDARRT